jgi:hypothetical protein
MLPLCEHHHHLVHEGGWTLELFPDRMTIWRTPDGALYHEGLTLDRLRPTGGRRPRRCGADVTIDVAAELENALASVLSRAPP